MPADATPPALTHTRVDLTFWINRAKANAAGKVPVSLRITVHGKRAEVSTGIRCLPDEWDAAAHRLLRPDRRDKAGQARADKLNTVLSDLEAQARLIASDLRIEGRVTAAAVRDRLVPPPPAPPVCALSVFETALLTYASQYSAANTRTALAALRKYAGVTGLTLTQLTPSYCQGFAGWLVQQGLPPRYGSHLRTLFARAQPGQVNPFPAVKYAKAGDTLRPRYVLTRAELSSLANLDLPCCLPRVARDIYLAQYYLHGSRVGVVVQLTWAQVDEAAGRVRFKAEKGGGWHNVAIRPPLAAILLHYRKRAGTSPYVFPLLPADYASLPPEERYKMRKRALVNVWRGLRTCEQLLGLPGRLHSHTARHTLATHTVQATGNFRLAQQMLGHADLAMTERYVRSMLPDELDSAADAVYNAD